MNGVQCNELFGGSVLKYHAFSIFLLFPSFQNGGVREARTLLSHNAARMYFFANNGSYPETFVRSFARKSRYICMWVCVCV